MILPLIDSHSQFFYQYDYAQTGFDDQNYSHLKALSEQQDSDLSFLFDYLNEIAIRNSNSFNRYRNEVERFVLWLWHLKGLTLKNITSALVAEYFLFVSNPPNTWQVNGSVQRFIDDGNNRLANPCWRPFSTKAQNYESRASTFTVMKHFCSALVKSELLATNPVAKLRKQDRQLSVLRKPTKVAPYLSIEALEAHFSQHQDDIHQVRDVLMYYLARHTKVGISDLAHNNHNSSLKLKNLDTVNKRFHYYANRQLTTVELCDLGKYIASTYIELRGGRSVYNHPLFHKIRGDGGYEVRQIRRILNKLENQVKNNA